MKIKMLSCLIVLTGAVLISATSGYSFSTYGTDVNTICAPDTPYTGDCLLCHTAASKADPTPAKTAYLAGGTTLTDFFCPTNTTPPPTNQTSWAACTPEQVGPYGTFVRVRVVNCNVNPAGAKNGWMTLLPAATDNMLETILAAMDANKGIAVSFDGSTDAEGYNYATALIYKK